MMRIEKIKYLLLVGALLLNSFVFAQHESMYSQYMFNGITINPAYCGSNGALNATLSYKNQWTGFGTSPKSLILGGHSPLKNESSNVGFTLMNERFGITNKNRFNLVYAYRIILNKKIQMRFGLQAGFQTVRNNYDLLTVIDNGDKSFINSNQNNSTFVSGTGLYVHSDVWFAGVSSPVLFAINKTGQLIYKPNLFYGGYLQQINANFSVQPSLLIKYIKASPLQLDANVLLNYKQIGGIGLSYRTSKTLVTNLYYNVNKQFFVGYSIDVNIGKLAKLASTSHEILFKYVFGYSKEVQNPKTFY